MNPLRMTERRVEFSSMFAGKLVNWMLVFNKVASGKSGIGYANIITKKSSVVEGVIYKTANDSIKKLDRFEGFPKHYEKKIMTVETPHGFIDCVVYVANEEKTLDGLCPENEYLSHLLKGKEFLSKNYFDKLSKLIK